MKRTLALILTFVFAFSMITANAALPKFLTEEYTNYTSDYSITMSFESSDEIIALLKELEMPDEVENFVNLKSLLESLLSQGAQMTLQADISEDFRKAELALTSDMKYSVIVNSNLSVGADMKMGMWLKMDLSAETPVFEVIYSHPMLNKYMVIDIFEMTDDEGKVQMLTYLDNVFSREFLDSITDFSVELIEKYADIRTLGTTCTVKFDNESLLAMLGELFPFIFETVESTMSNAFADDPALSFEDVYGGFPDLSGIQILGENGISYKYSLLSGKISAVDMSADISIDISKIAEAFGGEWLYESKGILDFLISGKVKMTKLGKTKVTFPVLTAENSFSFMDMMPEAPEEDYEYEPSYPYYYASAYTTYLPVIDGEIYVPLRAIMEDAYYDQVVLEYDNGIITARSHYFPDFTVLKLSENSDTAFTDSIKHKVSKVIIKDGTTYVGKSLLEDLFGWELGSAYYDMISKEYSVSFYTQSY